MHQDEVAISAELVRGLVADQMPKFADLPITLVEPWGTDNAIWRLGAEMVVRLPRISWARHQPEAEARWLPQIAPHVDIQIPEPVALGQPGFGYPWSWSIHRWVPGEDARLDRMEDPCEFARRLAGLVQQLHDVPIHQAPAARNRARPLAEYDEETRRAISSAAHLIDANAALAIWEEALAAPAYDAPPRWVHGDLEGNCVAADGRLAGIIDWGLACVGDPAVDVQVVWSPLCSPTSRAVFLETLDVDAATLARSRGAAINQACAALPYYQTTHPLIVERSWHKLAALGVAPRGGVSGPAL